MSRGFTPLARSVIWSPRTVADFRIGYGLAAEIGQNGEHPAVLLLIRREIQLREDVLQVLLRHAIRTTGSGRSPCWSSAAPSPRAEVGVRRGLRACSSGRAANRLPAAGGVA